MFRRWIDWIRSWITELVPLARKPEKTLVGRTFSSANRFRPIRLGLAMIPGGRLECSSWFFWEEKNQFVKMGRSKFI